MAPHTRETNRRSASASSAANATRRSSRLSVPPGTATQRSGARRRAIAALPSERRASSTSHQDVPAHDGSQPWYVWNQRQYRNAASLTPIIAARHTATDN